MPLNRAGRKIKGYPTPDSPSVGGKRRMIKRHRRRRDVAQLNELVRGIVRSAGPVWRMVHYLADDERTDSRAGVFRPGGPRELRNKVFFARADDVPAEGDAVLGGAEGESVAVTRQVG